MPTTAERNAAFDAVKPIILADVPSMFSGYITDAKILEATDAALEAAERARAKRTELEQNIHEAAHAALEAKQDTKS